MILAPEEIVALKAAATLALDDAPELGEYMHSVWVRGGKRRCVHCSRPVYEDNGNGGSGFWIHAGHGDVDGMNGLYCSPGMWDGSEDKLYSGPVERPKDDLEFLARGVLRLAEGYFRKRPSEGEGPREIRDRLNDFHKD